MAIETKVEGTIPRIYKRNTISLLMFSFVQGVRTTLHTISVKQALCMFKEVYNLTEEEFNVDSALTTYSRMQQEFFDL